MEGQTDFVWRKVTIGKIGTFDYPQLLYDMLSVAGIGAEEN